MGEVDDLWCGDQRTLLIIFKSPISLNGGIYHRYFYICGVLQVLLLKALKRGMGKDKLELFLNRKVRHQVFDRCVGEL